MSDDEVGDLDNNRGPEKDDALVDQPAVDVEGALASRSLLDDHGDKWAHSLALVSLRRPESSRRLAGSCSLGRCPQLAWGGLARGRGPKALARLGLRHGYLLRLVRR